MSSEEELKEIVTKIHELELQSIPDNDVLKEKYTLSDTFYAKMERLIKKHERNEKRKSRRRFIAAASVVIIILFSVSNPRYIVKACENIMRWFEDHVEIHFREESDTGQIPEYHLNYVPEGYELEQNIYYEISGLQVYWKEDELLTFEYSVSSGDICVDNEEMEYIQLKTENGETIHYFKALDDKASSITWLSNDGDVMFTIVGKLAEEELLEMQKNIVEIN